MRSFLMLLSRFGAVGALNTVISLSIIMGLEWAFVTPPALANAAGYGVGIMSGFVLSRGFVFRSQDGARSTAPRYLATVLAGFCLNQLVLAEAHALLGPGMVQHLAAQLCAMASYTVSVFLACRLWVFRDAGEAAEATAAAV